MKEEDFIEFEGRGGLVLGTDWCGCLVLEGDVSSRKRGRSRLFCRKGEGCQVILYLISTTSSASLWFLVELEVFGEGNLLPYLLKPVLSMFQHFGFIDRWREFRTSQRQGNRSRGPLGFAAAQTQHLPRDAHAVR